jgi:hypothetical protein
MGVTSSIRGLRRLPVAKVLAAAEIVLLAHDHVVRLEPHERRRVLELLMAGRGRPRNLTAAQRAELNRLLAKADPRLFAGRVADKLSPVKLPNRVVRGKRQR